MRNRSYVQHGVEVQLDDGGSIALGDEEVDALYDLLWLQARRGSITAAAKLFEAKRFLIVRGVAQLDQQESAAFRSAYEKLLRDSRT